MKVITFSRFFPKGHPRQGQPTHFVEKVEACLADTIPGWEMPKTFTLHEWHPYYNCTMPKGHTIRAGNRWKPGNMASLRVWSDKPYRSKQVEFAQVEVKKVWRVEINMFQTSPIIKVENRLLTYEEGIDIAANDGLSLTDFISWFAIHPKKKEQKFSGQIIAWNPDINY